jgi:hypothetical protein
MALPFLQQIKNFFDSAFLTDEYFHKIARQGNLEKLVQYCERNGLEFIPEEVTRFPKFARKVNKLIEEKARERLPQRQFNLYDRFFGPSDDLSKYVETGGILGCDGKNVFEITVSLPDENNVRVYTKSPENPSLYIRGKTSSLAGDDPAIIVSSTKYQIDPETCEKAEILIDWHTHPNLRNGAPLSEGDVDFMNWFNTRFADKPIYSVVFTPGRNKAVWYQAKSKFKTRAVK